MVEDKGNSNPSPNQKSTPSCSSTPFEKRGSKEVPPASYKPPIKVPKQPKIK